jgi:hypothetical protein
MSTVKLAEQQDSYLTSKWFNSRPLGSSRRVGEFSPVLRRLRSGKDSVLFFGLKLAVFRLVACY